MNKKSIAIVVMSSWQGLYIDGELVTEGRTLRIDDLADALKLDIHYHYPDGLPHTKAARYYYRYSHLPEKLSDTFEK